MGKCEVFAEIEVLERTELRSLQLKRLQRQISRCFQQSLFYHKKWADAGFTLDSIEKLEDITKLPFTFKREIRDDQSKTPPWGNLVLTDSSGTPVEVHPSFGTTGIPIYTFWSSIDIQNITDYTTRMFYSCGVRPGDILHNAFRYHLRMGGITVQRVAEKLGCFVLPIGDAEIKTQVELLINLRPAVLFAVPSFAFVLAEVMRERGIDPTSTTLKIGCFGGEPGVEIPATRSRLERELGIKAFDMYGITEIGPLMAAECLEHDGLHIAEDHHLVEVINPETYEPCNPGEVGVLVITDLTRDAMPLIRYWTNDLAVLDYNKCGCGRTHVKLKGGILGRTDDLVIFKGMKFYPAQVENVLHSFNELGNEYKIILHKNELTNLEQCIVKVECLTTGLGLDWLKDKLIKDLWEELRVNVDVELVPFGSIERDIMKTKRVMDNRIGHISNAINRDE